LFQYLPRAQKLNFITFQIRS